MELTKAVQSAINPGTNPSKANYSFVDDLRTRREAWEGSIYKQSTDVLYEQLLTPAYSKYVEMTKNDTNALIVRKELEDFININNLSFKASTHTLVKLVRCIFGDVDRRRVSTYGVTLRAAFAAKKDPKDLADFIRKNGGVQEIKLGQSETFVSMADKAEMAKEHFDNMKALGTASSEMLSLTADADFMGDTCVLLAEQNSQGGFDIKVVIRNASVVKAAFAAMYSKQQEVTAEAKRVVDAANDAEAKLAKAA